MSERIVARAKALGFERVGIAPAKRVAHADQYLEWLREGRHGEMDYLDRYHEQRSDPSKMDGVGARSVVVLLKNYYRESDALAGGCRIARYAHGDDYHDVLWGRMRELASFIHAEAGVDVATRPACDTAPVLERDLAAMAGLGWVGKNAMLINPEVGSFTFIAEVLVDMELEGVGEVVPDRCGSCSRCLDACPTGAIVSPQVIDARRCISYLTIEKRGPIPRGLRPLMGDHLFGCDICQDVCPWNRWARATEDEAFGTREQYRGLTPARLLGFDRADYVAYFSKSAMKRAKLEGLKRNAAVVLGNVGGVEALDGLMACYEREEHPLVRGHIAWAVGRVSGARARRWLAEVQEVESDPYVAEEIRQAREDRWDSS